ncbi:MAG: hypothetical protein IKI24_08160, partial [Clostridia bacterium]|nr:hypothetical protein [Clostridia bacterium]
MTVKRVAALLLSLLLLLGALPSALADSPHTHNWKEKSRVEPTCTKDGYAVYTCSCGARKTETLPALGHEFSKQVYTSYADCEHYGVFYWVCERCGAHSLTGNDAPLGHDWDDGTVTKTPTETEDGEITYTCRRDPSHTRTEVIPATGSGEKTPALKLHWLDADPTQPLDPDGECAVPLWVSNSGNVTLDLVYYAEFADGTKDSRGKASVGEFADFVPGKDAHPVFGYGAASEHVTPGTETEDKLGTVSVTVWVAGCDPETGKELCVSPAITRSWDVAREGGGVHPAFVASGSWADDAGIGKGYDGAIVEYTLGALNTGDCPLTFKPNVGGDAVYVNGPSGPLPLDSLVTLEPGQSFEYGILGKVKQDFHVKTMQFYAGRTLRAAYTDKNGEKQDDLAQYVEITFPLTAPDEGPHPSLNVSASWADDAGEGKRYEGAEVDVAFTVTNTGNCPVEWYYNAPQVISCTGPSGSLSANTHIEMQPSEHVTYIYRYTVAQSHVESGLLEVSQASWGWYTDKNGERTIVYSNTVFEEYIPLTYPEVEPEHHPSLLLSIWSDGHVYISSGSGIDHYEYAIKIDYILKNTGDIPLKFRTPSYYASVEEYAVLDPEEAFDSHFSWIIKYDTGSSIGGFDDIVYTSENPKYIGYFDFSLKIPGYDVDDKDPGPGTELCVSNEDSLRVWIKNPDYIEEGGPESGNADFCSLATTGVSDTSVSYNLHTCYKHLETAEAAEKLSLAGDWAGAAELWREETEKLYAKMAENAGEALAEALNEDKEAFFEYADAVQALFGDEKAAELMRLRCAEMCCVKGTAPIRLPSSLLGGYETLDASESFEVSGRKVGALNGCNSEVVEHYAGPAAEAMAKTRALL